MKITIKLFLITVLMLTLLFASIPIANSADDCEQFLSNLSKQSYAQQYSNLSLYQRCLYGISDADLVVSDNGFFPISAQGIYFVSTGFATPIENDADLDVVAVVLPAVCYPDRPSTPCTFTAEDVEITLIGTKGQTWEPYFINGSPKFDNKFISGETVSDDGHNFLTILFLSNVADYQLLYVRLLQRGQPAVFVAVSVLT